MTTKKLHEFRTYYVMDDFQVAAYDSTQMAEVTKAIYDNLARKMSEMLVQESMIAFEQDYDMVNAQRRFIGKLDIKKIREALPPAMTSSGVGIGTMTPSYTSTTLPFYKQPDEEWVDDEPYEDDNFESEEMTALQRNLNEILERKKNEAK